jgi:hypothetical protein
VVNQLSGTSVQNLGRQSSRTSPLCQGSLLLRLVRSTTQVGSIPKCMCIAIVRSAGRLYRKAVRNSGKCLRSFKPFGLIGAFWKTQEAPAAIRMPPLARPGQGAASARTARSDLRLVHGRVRHARSKGGEGAAGSAVRPVGPTAIYLTSELRPSIVRFLKAYQLCASPRPQFLFFQFSPDYTDSPARGQVVRDGKVEALKPFPTRVISIRYRSYWIEGSYVNGTEVLSRFHDFSHPAVKRSSILANLC